MNDNLRKIDNFIRLKDFWLNYTEPMSEFLSKVMVGDFKIYAYIEEAVLLQQLDPESSKEIDRVYDEFLQVNPGAFYSPFIGGTTLKGNFLQTEKPIESWLPDYDEQGLWYMTTPCEVDAENLFLEKTNLKKNTILRHQQRVLIREDWSAVNIDDKWHNLQEKLAHVLQVLKAMYPLDMSFNEILETYPDKTVIFKMNDVVKRRTPDIYSLVDFGNGINFPKRRYKASPALADAKLVKKSKASI